ncbi:MAG TPA: carboxypeptidase regulatory-like domain-containing protein [Solirubrobacteraceae bacterium]|nr:carboxypeptidase regulatory-like domain-containing protein [Solirubrobacteraceae bacterium]
MHFNNHGRRLLLRAALVSGLSACGVSALPAVATATTTGISGTVTSAETSEPIGNANVCLFESTAEIQLKCVETNAKGEYEILEPAGTYKVEFAAIGYTTQWYLDETTWASATPVEVKSTGVTPEINAELEETGEGVITGRVTNASNGEGAAGVEVCAYGLGSNHCTETNGSGEYAISGLPAGSYSISFAPANSCEEEQGEKLRCESKSNYLSKSNSVKVKANKTTTENISLRPGGQVSGTITNASITHPGLAKITVCAEQVNGNGESIGGGSCAYTNGSGQYTVNALEGGLYKVTFSGSICTVVKVGSPWECPETYTKAYYQGQPTFQKAKAIAVTTGSNTGGINESLHEAFPTTPASTTAPALTGTPVVGQTLSCSQGSWSHEPTYLAYQWLRNGSLISGQTGSTYTLQPADQGRSITCTVWAGNGAGVASATSSALAIPVPRAVFVSAKVKGALQLITLRCPGPGACSGIVKLVARVTTGRGKRRKTSNVAIGSAPFSIAAGKSVTLAVRVTGQGPKLLIKSGRRGLKVQITGTGLKATAATLKAPKLMKRKKRRK